MEVLLLLNVVLALGGYILPIPAVALAWHTEFTDRNASPRSWRHIVSKIALSLVSAGLVFWIYAVIREIRGTYSYIEPSASVARWALAALIIFAALAESKVRKFLLLAAVGMFLFFVSSIGDWFI